MFIAAIIFLLVGVLGGLVSGFLGLGGGVIIVPLLTDAFSLLKIQPDHIYRLAIGTSMGSIIFSSIASARAHNEKAPLDWTKIKELAPTIIIGTLAGSFFATRINTTYLKAGFTVFLFALAIRMLFNLHLKPRQHPLPIYTIRLVGLLIGATCSLVGIGGGTLIVPFLTWNGATLHRSIGTSAALGFFVALSGASGYIINGLGEPNLPWGSIGYIHVPALLGIVCVSVFTAPLGARLAHKVTPKQLKVIFGFIMLLLGASMLWHTITGVGE